jgi:hypothetical protein
VLVLSAEKVRRSTVRPASPGWLSPEHEKELTGYAPGESGISPEVAAARGYFTAARQADVPKVFAGWQRRLGLVVPSLSPDGVNLNYQLKPNKPIVRKSGKAPRYETPERSPITLDVNPLMLTQVQTGTSDLWVTEGCKKVDALASRGIPAVGLTGVNMAAVPGTKGTVPLQCWHHVRLEDRTVIVVFDSDARTNPNVQTALRRMVAMLEKLGAIVLVVYLPSVNGDSKSGVDDYLAAGGNVAELRLMAHPFVPVDIRHERLSKDEELRLEVQRLWSDWEAMPTVKDSDCTDRSTKRELIRHAEERGKTTADGIKVAVSVRTLAPRVGIGRQGVANSIKRLVEKGDLRKAPGPRGKKKAQAYVLLSKVHTGSSEFGGHYGEKHWGEEESQVQDDKGNRLSNGEYGVCVHQTRNGRKDVPELRSSKVVHQWERIESPNGGRSRRRVVSSVAIARLGKKRGEIVRYLVKAGEREVTVSELMERFTTPPKTERAWAKRVWDFKRDCLADLQGFRMQKTRKVDRETLEEVDVGRTDLGPPIIEIDGDIVRLTPKWRENLEIVRTLGEEQEDAKLQAEKIARERERFHNPEKVGPEAEPTPDMPEREEVRRILRAAAERDEASYIEWQRDKVGVTAEVFVHDVLAKLGKIRMELLIGVWKDEGGRPEQITFAVKKLRCEVLRLRNYGNEWFVYPPEVSEPKPEPESVTPLPRQRSGRAAAPGDRDNLAAVVELHRTRQATAPKAAPVRDTKPVKPSKKDGIFEHKADCECDWCGDEVLLRPRYAHLYRREELHYA